jgi:dihydrodipicolinate synthase/N-acetylneuraminate lyase
MKAAMVAAGIFKSGTMRAPTVEPNDSELNRIRAAVARAGLTRPAAAE